MNTEHGFTLYICYNITSIIFKTNLTKDYNEVLLSTTLKQQFHVIEIEHMITLTLTELDISHCLIFRTSTTPDHLQLSENVINYRGFDCTQLSLH